MGTRLPAQLARYLQANSVFRVSPDDAVAEAVLQDPAWRRVVLLGAFAAVLAFALGFVAEPRNAGTPDRIIYGLAAIVLLGLELVLLLRPQSLKMVTTAIIGGSGAFFLVRAVYLLFLAPSEVDIPKEMTESFFWVPVVYVMGYLIPGLTLGRTLAFGVNLVLLLFSIIYFVATLGSADIAVLLALAELNLANWTFAYAVRNFSVYKELALKAHATSEAMTRLAHTDALTGLANRLHFERALQADLHRHARKEQQCAVVFIDLDNFKQVNDTLGHAAGDELLSAVAARLRQNVRDEDLLARISGDEFVLLLPHIRGADAVDAAIAHLRDAFARPFQLTTYPVTVTASIGYCLFPEDGDTAEALLEHADTAMYQAKTSGRANSRRYVSAGRSLKAD